MTFAVTENIAKSARHTTFYLSSCAPQAPAIVFCPGWPELSISWRQQLPTVNAALAKWLAAKFPELWPT